MGWGVLSQVSSLGSLQSHLPGYIGDYEKLTKAGAEVIACVSINDAFVMSAWGTANGSSGKVTLRQVLASRTSALCDMPSRSAGQLSKSEGRSPIGCSYALLLLAEDSIVVKLIICSLHLGTESA